MKRKRIDLNSAGIGSMFFTAFTNPVTAKSGWRLLWVVIRYFFYPQFQSKFRPFMRPVKAVDHPLDDSIPFTPKHVSVYLSFFHCWIKSAYFVYRYFGKKSLPYLKDFMIELADLYKEAGKVYLKHQSTTARPNYKEDNHFKVIHFLDPHLHCVPSLHIMVVTFNYFRIPKIIEKLNVDGEDFSKEIQWMHDQAVSISESVLFIKQHSVNCIPAALFSLSSLMDEFTDTDAFDFSDKFFTILGTDLKSKDEIRTFFKERYTDFRNQKINGQTHDEIILKFLENYSLQSVQN